MPRKRSGDGESEDEDEFGCAVGIPALAAVWPLRMKLRNTFQSVFVMAFQSLSSV